MTLQASQDAHANKSPAEMRRSLWRTYLVALDLFLPASTDVLPPGATTNILPRSATWSGGACRMTEPNAIGTADVLKALLMIESRGLGRSGEANALFNRVLEGLDSEPDFVVVALVLWGAASGARPESSRLLDLLSAKIPPENADSLGLGMALSAVCHYMRQSGDRRAAADLARELFVRILANQDAGSGLFYGSNRREGWLRRRHPDATLSSQTYPVLAFGLYSETFGDKDALARAERCADRLCELQGPLGQWWRRYDARRGRVVSEYPVYSVNQDATVPMALMAVEQLRSRSAYSSAIDRGLAWTFGANELGTSLVDETRGLITGSVRRGPEGFERVDEMYAYQPARGISVLLSHPTWAALVTG